MAGKTTVITALVLAVGIGACATREVPNPTTGDFARFVSSQLLMIA